MRTATDCIPCFVRQTLDACRMSGADEAVRERILREVLRWMSELNFSISPPAFAQRIHRRLRELTGVADPYQAQKEAQNRMALDLLPDLRALTAAAEDPLLMAAHLAVAGNIIDLGAKSGLTDAEVHEALRHAVEVPLEGDCTAFQVEVKQARRILYLADNAGEIVFDQLLIEQLGPDRVTVAVRGGPVINDATLEDARLIGLTERVRVMDNGSDAPGTLPEECSPAFRSVFDAADLIISKGQGNFETLSGCGRNIFYLLKVKCPVVADSIGLPVGSPVLRHERAIS